MMAQPYDPVGAMGGMFAPAYIYGNPESEAAVQKWQAENFAMTPAMVEATRGPSTTITEPGVMGRGSGLGSTTTTVPGSVDPAALKIMAQGGHYTPKAAPVVPPAASGGGTGAPSNPRDAIASVLANRGAGTLTPVGGGVFLPEFDTSGGGLGRAGYPWGQLGPPVSS
jgi:hypothetical protein